MFAYLKLHCNCIINPLAPMSGITIVQCFAENVVCQVKVMASKWFSLCSLFCLIHITLGI